MASRHQRIGRGKEIVRVSVKGHFGAGAELPAWRALCFNRNKTSKGIWRVIPGRKRKKKKDAIYKLCTMFESTDKKSTILDVYLKIHYYQVHTPN